jgi:RimJ/RimL family protein N-acetyltransferase
MTLPTEPLATARLDLRPLRPGDADEMAAVLADPGLYTFTGGSAPSGAALLALYRRQSAGRSADGTQQWHNWIVRLRRDGDAIGFVQATVVGAGGSADIAWLIGVGWQRHGFASEAVGAMVDWLERGGVSRFTAHIHPDHEASAAVAARAGLKPTDELEDGEQVWRRG